jgi:hypothetical protein
MAQKEHKAYERGEARKEIAELPRHKIIVLDGEGSPAIGRVERSPSPTLSVRQRTSRNSVVNGESIDLDSSPGAKASLKHPRTLSEQGIKQEPIDLGNFESSTTVPYATIKLDLTHDEPSAKRVKFEVNQAIDIGTKIEDDEDEDIAEKEDNIDEEMGEVAKITEHENYENGEENFEEEIKQDVEETEEDRLAIAELEAEISGKRIKEQAKYPEFYQED